mmetsp:Transcript_11359/g.36115  ORF Transcript_11359/g.36115 Transcript_11359/m.36115 type:complete len:300 (+) Transcript_11359:377-1276(+)
MVSSTSSKLCGSRLMPRKTFRKKSSRPRPRASAALHRSNSELAARRASRLKCTSPAIKTEMMLKKPDIACGSKPRRAPTVRRMCVKMLRRPPFTLDSTDTSLHTRVKNLPKAATNACSTADKKDPRPAMRAKPAATAALSARCSCSCRSGASSGNGGRCAKSAESGSAGPRGAAGGSAGSPSSPMSGVGPVMRSSVAWNSRSVMGAISGTPTSVPSARTMRTSSHRTVVSSDRRFSMPAARSKSMVADGSTAGNRSNRLVTVAIGWTGVPSRVSVVAQVVRVSRRSNSSTAWHRLAKAT